MTRTYVERSLVEAAGWREPGQEPGEWPAVSRGSMSQATAAPTAGRPRGPGLAGSLGRSGRGAEKSSDPVGVAGRQNCSGSLIQEYCTMA